MKILHLIDIPWWSGLSAYAFDCINAHREAGHKVFLACEKNSLSHRKASEMGLETIAIGGRNPFSAVGNFWKIGATIAENQPDCVIAHTGSTHWIAAGLGIARRISVIRVRASSQKVKIGILNQKIYLNSRMIVTASNKLKQELEQFSDELNGKIQTIYPPVEIPARTSQPKSGIKKIGIVARLDPVKGYPVFLESAKTVQGSFSGVEFHIAGAEENLHWNDILKKGKELGLKNIFYHGFLSAEKVRTLMENCDVGVVSSIGSEEVSRALMEWMSAGKPVVAAAVGCVPEILHDGKGGYVVEPESGNQLGQKINALFGDPVTAQKFGEYNRSVCREKFSRENFKTQWENVLSRCKSNGI